MMERAVHVKCMGGLGNQLFQYWTAYSLARKNNCPVFCDPRKGFREWARTNILRKCTNRPFVLNKFSKMNVARKKCHSDQIVCVRRVLRPHEDLQGT